MDDFGAGIISKIERVTFDFPIASGDRAHVETNAQNDKPSIPSRPWRQKEPVDVVANTKEPLWIKKRRMFWRCGAGSVWRTPIAIIWIVATISLVIYETWNHLGPSSEQYRHEAAIAASDYYDQVANIRPLHVLVDVAGDHAGWRKPHLEKPLAYDDSWKISDVENNWDAEYM